GCAEPACGARDGESDGGAEGSAGEGDDRGEAKGHAARVAIWTWTRRSLTMEATMSQSAEDIAWAAGLFEGEGSITQSGGRVRLSLKMTDEESVRRFAKIIQRGTVYGLSAY